MNLILKRSEYRADGIFSTLTDESGKVLFAALEHSYDSLPKLNKGVHACILGAHRLHGMTKDFQTFEITGVPGHSNILFHWGNFNSDSDGCVLLGRSRVGQMVTSSRDAFAAFMKLQDGVKSFILTVE